MNNNHPSKRTFFEMFKADLKIALSIIGRTLVVLIILSIAVASGYGIPYLLRKPLAHLLYGGAALGAGVVLAAFKDLVETTPAVWRYISSGTTERLSDFFVRAFMAFLGFYLAFFSIQPSRLPAVVRYGDSLITFYITFPEKSSELPDSDPQRQLLKDLLRSINECLIGNQETVELRVIGFASTSGTDEYNLTLSNERAKWIADYIMKEGADPNLIDDPARLKVYTELWETHSEMKRHRIFKDRPGDAVYSEKAGRLNRRVEIHMLRAAGCELGERGRLYFLTPPDKIGGIR